MTYKKSGFTLIELLVVVAIIGLLATIIMVSLNSARVKARNTKRNQDAKQLMTAFAMVANNAGGLIPEAPIWTCIAASCYGGWTDYQPNAALDAAISPYIKKPDDPANSTRGYGGYLFANPVIDLGQGAGAYLVWLMEPVTVAAGVCGPGFVYETTANYIECAIRLSF